MECTSEAMIYRDAVDWINGMDTSIFAIDQFGTIIIWNQQTEAIFGYSSDEVVNHSLLVLAFDDRLIEQIFAVGNPLSERCFKLKRKDGFPINVGLKTSVQRNADGEFNCLVCFVEKLESLHRRFWRDASCYFRNESTMLFSLDASGVIDVWNEATAENTGYSEEEAIGKCFLDLIGHLYPGDFLRQEFISAMRSSGESTFKVVLSSKDGKPLHLIVTSSERLSPVGYRIGTLFAAYHDPDMLSYGRSLETVLYAMLLESWQLIDSASTPIFGIDIEGDVNEWNDMMVKITGHHKESAFDTNFVNSFVMQESRQAFQEILNRGLNGCATCGFEFEIKSVNGETRHLLLNASSRRDMLGRIVGVLFVAVDVTEQLLHTRAMDAMSRDLRQLIDSSNVPIFGIDVDSMVNEWNDPIADITGFTADEAFNQPIAKTFVVPSPREMMQEILDKALHGEGTSSVEIVLKAKNNETRHLLLSVTTRRDAENIIVGAFGVAQDVTEAAKQNLSVATMANELRQLIDTANAPIFGIDIDGDVNEWNDKTVEVTGFTKAEAFDRNLVDTFIVPSLRDSVQNVLDNALEGKGTANYGLEFRTKSNEVRHLLVNATTRRNPENKIVGVLGVAQDVTDAVNRDWVMTTVATELRQLIETANAPIFGIDRSGCVNEWNNKTAEVTGYSKNEAFDEPFVATFISPSMQHQVAEIMSQALVGNATSNYELEIISKANEVKVLLVNATPRRDPDHKIIGVVGVAQDVTGDRQQRKLLQQLQYLQASQEAKVETERNMTAYFAHELRNPLGAIDCALNAMPDDLPASVRSLISGMQLCTGFMSSIMNNLLDVRKMEEGKMTLNNAPISLPATLHAVHKMLLPSVKQNVEFISICESSGRDWVYGDTHRIQQILTNVITNAIKYTVSGSITLSLRWIENRVCFRCDDTGPGIPKGVQKQLFERYVQRGGAPGTGLGLAIAKNLVSLMGGEIRFESDPSVKPGTSCIVTLSLVECPAPDSFVVEDNALIERSISFLIVDDVKMNRVMLKRRILKGIAPNATIHEASTGEDALLICGTEKFDVIVVDQFMEEAGGVMVGTDVVFALRRMRIDSIVIGCSGNDIDEQYLEAGANFVWKKPMPSNSRIISDLRCAMAKSGKEPI